MELMNRQNQLIEFARACNIVASVLLGDSTQVVTIADSPELSGKSATDLDALLYEIFSLNVFPYANLYLSTELIAGGPTGLELAERYRDWHFRPTESNLTADHFGMQFSALEHQLLTAVEHWRHGNTAAYNTAQQSIAEFCQVFLTPALIPFAAALVLRTDALAKNLGTILLNLNSELSQITPPQENTARPAEQVKQPTVDDSLTELVQFLLTPIASGCWISKRDIRDIASILELPCGFSTREDMLTNLFHAAGSYEQTIKLILAIQEIFRTHQNLYEDWRPACGNTIMDRILIRVKTSQSLLLALEQKARSGDTAK